MLPQTWIVLAVFVLCIIFNMVMVFTNEKYRKSVYKNSTYEMVTYASNIIVMAIVLTYSVQCSVKGSYVMPSCNVFSWVLTLLLVIMFFFNLGSKIYLYVMKQENTD
jgi:magnesium-transporting ATPase (P-type)